MTKFYAASTLIVLSPALLAFELLTVLFAVRRKTFTDYVRAVLSFLRSLPVLLKKRRAIQASRVVPDLMLLSAFPLTLGQGTVQGSIEKTVVDIVNLALSKYWIMASHLIGHKS